MLRGVCGAWWQQINLRQDTLHRLWRAMCAKWRSLNFTLSSQMSRYLEVLNSKATRAGMAPVSCSFAVIQLCLLETEYSHLHLAMEARRLLLKPLTQLSASGIVRQFRPLLDLQGCKMIIWSGSVVTMSYFTTVFTKLNGKIVNWCFFSFLILGKASGSCGNNSTENTCKLFTFIQLLTFYSICFITWCLLLYT